MAQRADIRNDLLRPNHLPAVAVPDLQITGWAGRGVCGGHHPDPLRWGVGGGGAWSAKNFFRSFGPQFGLNISTGGGPSLDPSLSTGTYSQTFPEQMPWRSR